MNSPRSKGVVLGYEDRRGAVADINEDGFCTGTVKVLQGVEFEVEPQEDHKFEAEPHGNVDHVVGSQEAGLKDDIDARSDIYVLSNGCKKCSDDSDGYYWEYTSVQVSQLKLVQNLLKGHSTLSLEDSLSMDCDVKKMTDVQVFVDFDYAMGRSITVMGRQITGYGLMILRCGRSLQANLQSRYELRLVADIATGALVKVFVTGSFIALLYLPYSPCLCQEEDGSMRMCIELQELNKGDYKKTLPLSPILIDLFDQMTRWCCFSKIDLRLGYHQLRVREEDIPCPQIDPTSTIDDQMIEGMNGRD
ncbi:hypothetical protein Tco_0633142 [Tanacetum coccineum]